MPLFDIFITSVTPIITRTATEASIASKILKISESSSNNFKIFSSAIGWHTPCQYFIGKHC